MPGKTPLYIRIMLLIIYFIYYEAHAIYVVYLCCSPRRLPLQNVGGGTAVVQVRATDRDAGLNSVLSYYITRGNEDLTFRMDRVTGEIATRPSPPDRERQSFYSLVVTVEDEGNPSLSVSHQNVLFEGGNGAGQHCGNELSIETSSMKGGNRHRARCFSDQAIWVMTRGPILLSTGLRQSLLRRLDLRDPLLQSFGEVQSPVCKCQKCQEHPNGQVCWRLQELSCSYSESERSWAVAHPSQGRGWLEQQLNHGSPWTDVCLLWCLQMRRAPVITAIAVAVPTLRDLGSSLVALLPFGVPCLQ